MLDIHLNFKYEHFSLSWWQGQGAAPLWASQLWSFKWFFFFFNFIYFYFLFLKSSFWHLDSRFIINCKNYIHSDLTSYWNRWMVDSRQQERWHIRKMENVCCVVFFCFFFNLFFKKGTLSTDLLDFDTLELDASLSCPGKRDSSCAQWDHTVQLFVCCDRTSPYCNMELGRWITAFRRYKARGKHW